MTALRHFIPAFVGGEIDPLMGGRIDTEQFSYGLAKCENFVPVNEGPLVKRPGFEYIRDGDPTSTWLSPFRFSITQEYLIEWGALKARFFTQGGRIETAPNVPYEVATPYAAAHAPYLSLQQSFDRLYIDHAGYRPAALTRTGPTTFAHANTTLVNGPFLDSNADEAVTVTVAGGLTVGGAATVTASAAIFAAGDVGAAFRIEAKDFSTMKAWEPGMDGIAINDVVRSDGKAYKALTAGKTGSKIPSHERGAEWDGQLKSDVVNAKGPYGVKWEYQHDSWGWIEISGFASATQVTGTVRKRLPDQVATVATFRWAHGAFSTTRGWPSAVLHAFGRQLHLKGLDVIGSVVNDYGGGQCNFLTTTSAGLTAADLGFRRTLDASDPPLWAVADRTSVLLGTASGELIIGPVNAAAAVSGENIQSLPQSWYGSEQCWPIKCGADLAFIERGGRRIRWTGYDFGRDRYLPLDLTAAARSVTKSGLVQLAWQRLPFAMLHAVRSDGQIAVHPATRLEIKAFARTVLANGSGVAGARALSAVAIVGIDGKTDELWLLVERQRADGLKKEIWKQTRWRELGEAQAEQFYVDAGVRADAAGGQTHFSGLTHLAGAAVAVLAGGGVVPGLTVSAGGELDLPAGSVPADPYVLIVGLPYTAEAVTLPPPVEVRSGTAQGLLKRVRKVVMRLLETMGLKVGGASGEDPLEELLDRPASAAMDAPVPLFSGDTPGVIEMSPDRNGTVRFVSAAPLAATISAAMLSLEIDEADA